MDHLLMEETGEGAPPISIELTDELYLSPFEWDTRTRKERQKLTNRAHTTTGQWLVRLGKSKKQNHHQYSTAMVWGKLIAAEHAV